MKLMPLKIGLFLAGLSLIAAIAFAWADWRVGSLFVLSSSVFLFFTEQLQEETRS